MKKLTKNKYVSFLMVATFLTNVMLPFFAAANISQIVSQFESSAFDTYALDKELFLDKKVRLCTGNGFKWVSLKELLQGEEKPIKHHTQYNCALCYVSAHHLDAFIPANVFTVTFNQSFQSALQFFLNDINIQNYSFHSIQARAPPHLA